METCKPRTQDRAQGRPRGHMDAVWLSSWQQSIWGIKKPSEGSGSPSLLFTLQFSFQVRRHHRSPGPWLPRVRVWGCMCKGPLTEEQWEGEVGSHGVCTAMFKDLLQGHYRGDVETKFRSTLSLCWDCLLKTAVRVAGNRDSDAGEGAAGLPSPPGLAGLREAHSG